MCPDRDLVSAYVDGEVPSPWRERIEEHLASCPDCAALVSSYETLGRRLRESPLGEEAASFERGRARFEAYLQGLATGNQSRVQRGRFDDSAWATWRRRVSLPLPLAAAAAALVLLLAGATTILALKPGKAPGIQAVASGVIAPPATEAKAQPASMEELLRYLDASDAQVTLTINLPTGKTFGSAGKPVIMRTGQVVRNPQPGMTDGGKSP